MTTTSWHLKQPITPAQLGQLLAPCTVDQVNTEHEEWSVLDDPSWHIWQQGQVLLYAHHRAALELWLNNRIQFSDSQASVHTRFPHQLSDQEMASILQSSVGIRAFIEHDRIGWEQTTLAVRNCDRKIIVRLRLIESGGTTLLSLHPLRGYQQEAKTISQQLSALEGQSCDAQTLRKRLLACGLQVTIPPGRLSFDLTGNEATQQAVLQMVTRLVELARQQEQGLCADIDTEYAHQYRVALRKARSLVALFKSALPQNLAQQLKHHLKQLAQRSNTLRDLDVFLLDRNDYYSLLPADLHRGLDNAFQRLKRRRNREQKKLAGVLSSSTYQDDIQQLLASLAEIGSPLTGKGARPIKTTASRKIVRQYQRICTTGDTINTVATDQAIHELRIECKKLRYLLELFAELYSRKGIKHQIKRLKQLQDILGRFNDLCVQQAFLKQLAHTSRDHAQVISLNALVAVLYQHHKQERQRVTAAISEFSRQEVADTAHNLVQNGELA